MVIPDATGTPHELLLQSRIRVVALCHHATPPGYRLLPGLW